MNLAIVMLLHHVVDWSKHFLSGAKGHWSLWHIAMLVVVNLMPGHRETGHGCSTCNNLPAKKDGERKIIVELPEGVRMSRF